MKPIYPSCANQTAKLVVAMADRPGISYLRTTRAAIPVIYGADEQFEVGGARVLRSSETDEVALVAAGATLHEALAAAEELEAEGVACRVIRAEAAPRDRPSGWAQRAWLP